MTGAAPSTVTGHVIDLACLRRYPESEYLDRARNHTTSCALMGHCVESGYGLVDDDGAAHLLDTEATPHVVATLQRAGGRRGVRLTASRVLEESEMRTTEVAEAPISEGSDREVTDTHQYDERSARAQAHAASDNAD